jgi:hypothetical protein
MASASTAFGVSCDTRQLHRDNGMPSEKVADPHHQNAFFVDDSGTFPRQFTGKRSTSLYNQSPCQTHSLIIDFPKSAGEERRQPSQEIHSRTLGDEADNPRDIMTWALLTGMASHDLSALRELIGMPKSVLAATRSPSGLFLTVVFE